MGSRSPPIGFHQPVGLHHELLGDDKWFCLHPHLLLESPVGYGQDHPTSPLRSIAITATFITTTSDSVPVPRIGTQVLVGSPLERLPSHRDDWFPQFRRKAWIRLTPPARRTPPGQPSGQPPDFSRRYHPPSVSMSCTGSRRVNGGSLAFVFLIHTCRVTLDVSPTLTTTTLHDSRLGWFEVCS